MKKFLLILGAILVIIFGVLTAWRQIFTKRASPADQVTLVADGLKLQVFYNRPYKKGREIFGGLVPYDMVWRTGANEATIFETNEDIIFGGKPLKAGEYSLFTIPGEQTWAVILNSETGQWGVDFNGETNRDPENDVVTVEVPSVQQEKEFEQFTISLVNVGEESELILMWDKTVVSVPISRE